MSGHSDCSVDYAVVVVAYFSRALLNETFARLAPPIPIIVVDNSAADENITDLVRARPMTKYINGGGNIGFGAACNLAAKVASQRYLAFINPDAHVNGAVLERLVQEVASDPRRSSAGPLLVDMNGAVRSGSGGWLPTPVRAVVHATGLFRYLPNRGIWIGRKPSAIVDVEWIAGTCLVIAAELFRELGGFSPRYFLYQEDMDLGRRLCARGYQQVIVRDLHVRHAAGTSSARSDNRRLAWLRASALVDYLFATQGRFAARLTCAILALGAVLRGVGEVAGGRTGRLVEYRTQAVAFAFPGSTLERIRAERVTRNRDREGLTSAPVTSGIRR